MRTAEEIFRKLQSETELFRQRFGVRSLGVFGSWARGEATPTSDVDILVDFEKPTFDQYMELKFHLEDLLQLRVDLVLRSNLKPALRDRVLGEVREVA